MTTIERESPGFSFQTVVPLPAGGAEAMDSPHCLGAGRAGRKAKGQHKSDVPGRSIQSGSPNGSADDSVLNRRTPAR